MMAGLSRFDFFPRDWFMDTRDLSDRAKGLYIDLLAAMYARGGPLPYEEHDLCSLCGYRNVRSLRAVLPELIDKGKIHLVDQTLVNNRTMEEIGRAEQCIADGKKGGLKRAENAKSSENERDITPIPPRKHADIDTSIQQIQELDLKLPSASPSSFPSEKASAPSGTGATAPPILDLRKTVFDQGTALLMSRGIEQQKARGHIGRWCSQYADSEVIEALAVADRNSAVEPVAYVGKVLSNAKAKSPSKPVRPLARDIADEPPWEAPAEAAS